MKKILIAFFALTLTFSCSDDITSLNQNVIDPTNVPANFLFSNAQKNLADIMLSTNVNNNVFRLFAQQWTETTYTDESNYDIATRNIAGNFWTAIYRDVLRDLQEAERVLDTEEYAGNAEELAELNAQRENRRAIIEILRSYSYMVLVDTYGDVPYTQALDIEQFPQPQYDNAETIYRDLISRLAAASAALDVSGSSYDQADLMYGGDADQWRKFANSLRLRMAINMDDVDHAYASQQATDAVNDGVFMSNSDNAAMQYENTPTGSNPVYVDVIASGRNDFVPANTIVDVMNQLNDPRRQIYFTEKDGAFVGGTYGSSSNFASFSHIGDALLEQNAEGVLMSYSQVEFLLAEAVERGIAVGGTAEEHYDAGITASMQYWGVPAAQITAYLAQPDVAYSTAAATWQEKIGIQEWLALYNNGFEAWTTYRRLDYPELQAPSQADITSVPVRYTYPAAEETLNSTNNSSASSAIGGNELTTRVFWDVQ